jgi:uncharacterized repeat protein (TIGR02059 family)
MKNLYLIFFFILIDFIGYSQITLTISGQSYTNSADSWEGVNIPRSVPTTLTFKNNSITSLNTSGYMLQCGDDGEWGNNNHLDGAVITGNMLTWNGTNTDAITHGMIAGFNINYVIKYNYLNKVPYGVIFKSGYYGDNMTYSTGGLAYNIHKNGKFAVCLKGMNAVPIYNNTFYNDIYQNSWYLIIILNNLDNKTGSPCLNSKIKNNIFYTKYKMPFIDIESASLATLQCDYNVYWCEEGDHEPYFLVTTYGSSQTKYTWAQWRALGFDAHSVVMNPNFINTTDFVPANRVDYGTNLGSEFEDGLSIDAIWSTINPAISKQNGTWQVGARVYAGSSNPVIPVYVGSSVENATPSVLEMNYSLSLANIVPAASAFTVMVNSAARTVSAVAISGTKVLLTLASPVAYGNAVTVAYTKPATNPLQTAERGQAATISAQPVTNNVASVIVASVKVFPNPTSKLITITIDDPSLIIDFIRILDLSGKVIVHNKVNPNEKEFKVLLNLRNGVYIVQLGSGDNTLVNRKLIVS